MDKIERAAVAGRLGKTKARAAGWILMALVAAGSEAWAAAPTCAAAPCGSEDLAQKWGIKVTSLHLSANGYMVDFRYKVLDPEKAATLGDPKAKPSLVDQATGAKLIVPNSPKVGPLRQSALNLTAGKVYFALFSNPGKLVKKGNKVTVAIGDFKAENLVVE
jgi:hypothetical protein